MWTIKFWKAVAERAIKSGSQGVVGLLIADSTTNAFTFNWQNALGVFVGGAVLSVLTSVGSAAVTESPGPSLTDAEVVR